VRGVVGGGIAAIGLAFLGAMAVVVLAALALADALPSATVALSATLPAPPGAVAGPALVAGIPTLYLRDAEVSGRRFGVPWSVLAGIYRVECDFGRSRLAGCHPRGTENASGAQGPGQFLAPTWRRGLAPGELIPSGPPTGSETGSGFATDGDGDGVADPWDPADAVASTARMLEADGGSGDIERAVLAYNHSEAYVDEVMTLAAGYRDAASFPAALRSRPAASAAAPPSSSSLPPAPGAAVAAVIAFARAQLGEPYRWGGAGPGAWDCSGLVMAAYAVAGVVLPHNAEAQYDTTAGATVPLDRLQPGDLVFFGPDLATIGHVGLYIGGGEMIDAPHAGATVRVESFRWSDLLVATRPRVVLAASA
jgi:cell wall-associated NlpC family hydrolase